MTFDQAAVFGILIFAMLLFIHGRVRYDLVAFSALLLATLMGLIPFKDAFSGLGNPAVITVAMVLIISKSIQDSGVLSYLSKPLANTMDRPLVFMAALMLAGAVLSGFMNNVGALALLMPLALQAKLPPALILMPLSFGTILGGLTTLIGTPPNIVVAQYRRELTEQGLTGEAFGLFSFAPVGALAAVVGILFILLIGWRLIPKRNAVNREGSNLFQISDYITEVRVGADSEARGKALYSLENKLEGELHTVGLIRNGNRMLGNLRLTKLEEGDLLLLRAHPDTLNELVSMRGLALEAAGDIESEIRSEDVEIIEAVVTPGSQAENRTPRGLFLRARYSLNLLAISRQGEAFVPRLQNVRFKAGDVALLQGDRAVMGGSLRGLGLLPLAERDLKLGGGAVTLLPLLIFGLAIAATAFSLLPVYISFSLAVVALIGVGAIEPKRIYHTIDWPIVVLLASMIPIGGALQTTGGTVLVANSVAGLSGVLTPLLLLTLILVVTMTLSDVMNNAATAVVMAPIAASVAMQLNLNPDPFLMAVAVGASCAFLTPIGHQNNLLVMGPGGYRFGDYWRMGLPLEVIVVAVSVPMIALVWPL